jgi:hypothetical protein
MATGLQLNWTAVGFTPSGGSLTTITRVTSVGIGTGGQLLPFSGDNDRFPTVIANVMNMPGASVTTGNIAQIMALSPGTRGTFTATHKDARGATNGDIVYTLINAVVASPDANGPHGSYGSGTVSWQAFSSDGSTNPLSFTRA